MTASLFLWYNRSVRRQGTVFCRRRTGKDKRMEILLAAALLPPLVLLFLMYRADKVEKEPPAVILKVFLFGVLSTIPAIVIETFGDALLRNVMGGAPLWLYNIFMFFLVVAWTEEGVKHFALKIGTWQNPAFNYTFDAILYSAVAALGFAAAENVEYVLGYGLQVAVMRAITAIPGHCIFGIYMGFYYGMAKFWDVRGDKGRRHRAMFMSMLVPILLHGFYDYCASANDDILILVFFAFIIILDVMAIRTVRKMARLDMPLDEPSDAA